MTTTTVHHQPAMRHAFDDVAPDFATAMGRLDGAATKELDKAGIEPGLRELVRARASQLNGCAYCIDMHTKDARALLLADTHVPDEAYDAVAAEFAPAEVVALVALIVTINAGNAIGVSSRAWVPGSYQP